LATAKENPIKGANVPDVKMFIKRSIQPDKRLTNFDYRVRELIAGQMSCKECEVTPEQIDLMVFRDTSGGPIHKHLSEHSFLHFSESDIIIEVAGYAYPSRITNIEDRLRWIAAWVKGNMKLDKVSITFIPVQEGYWTSI
jgi:hypothetical protein